MHVGITELVYGCNVVSSESSNDIESSQDRPLRSLDSMSTLLLLFHREFRLLNYDTSISHQKGE